MVLADALASSFALGLQSEICNAGKDCNLRLLLLLRISLDDVKYVCMNVFFHIAKIENLLN